MRTEHFYFCGKTTTYLSSWLFQSVRSMECVRVIFKHNNLDTLEAFIRGGTKNDEYGRCYRFNPESGLLEYDASFDPYIVEKWGIKATDIEFGHYCATNLIPFYN